MATKFNGTIGRSSSMALVRQKFYESEKLSRIDLDYYPRGSSPNSADYHRNLLDEAIRVRKAYRKATYADDRIKRFFMTLTQKRRSRVI